MGAVPLSVVEKAFTQRWVRILVMHILMFVFKVFVTSCELLVVETFEFDDFLQW